MPRLIRDFRSVTVSPGDEGRLVMHARGYLGQRARFDVVIRPGWCWIESRFLLCGMAAAPDGGGTRFGSLGGIRIPGVTLLPPAPPSRARRVRFDRFQADVRHHLDRQ